MTTSVLFGFGGHTTATSPTRKDMIAKPITAPSAIAMTIACGCYPICGKLDSLEIKAKGPNGSH